MLLIVGLTLVVGVIVYTLWVRPILRAKPSLAKFWADEDSFFAAVRLKFAGEKQRMTTALVFVAGIVVELNDYLAPLASQAGVDVTRILPQIPAEDWPFITMGLIAIVQYFRKLAENRKAL